jgi:hypothetical protein
VMRFAWHANGSLPITRRRSTYGICL